MDFITFLIQIKYDVKLGEEIYIFGDSPDFGNWNEPKFKLNWNEGNIWKANYKISKSSKIIKFKFVYYSNSNMIWEEGENRLLNPKNLNGLSKTKDGEYILDCEWNNFKINFNIHYIHTNSQAYIQIKRTPDILSNLKNENIMKLENNKEITTKDNNKIIGFWTFTILVKNSKKKFDFEYKYILYDKKSGKTIWDRNLYIFLNEEEFNKFYDPNISKESCYLLTNSFLEILDTNLLEINRIEDNKNYIFKNLKTEEDFKINENIKNKLLKEEKVVNEIEDNIININEKPIIEKKKLRNKSNKKYKNIKTEENELESPKNNKNTLKNEYINDIKNKEKEINELKELIENNKLEKNELIKKLKEAEKLIEKNKENNNKLKKELYNKDIELKKEKEKNLNYEDRDEDIKKDYNNLVKKIQELKNSNSNLKQELEDTKELNEELNNENKSLKQKQENNDKLKKELYNKEFELKKEKEKNLNYEDRDEDIKKDYNNLVKKIQELKNSNSNLKQELEDIKELNEELNKENKSLKQREENYKKKIKEYKEKIKRNKNEYEDELNKREEEICKKEKDFNNKLTFLEDKESIIEKEAKELEDKKKNLRKKMKELNKKILI